MKRPPVWNRALLAASTLCSVAALRAQPAPAAPEDEAPIVLSPFVVDASEDTAGYTAKSTLAGTRVRTDLKGISSATSVVTAQFLQDTASRNSQDLLVYTTNTEVAGLRGNFSGQGGNPQYNEALTNPSNTTRVRGLDTADNTRDFFLTDIPWDSFNVGRVDLQRGPNSILFGVGSPAGIINSSVNDATFKTAYRLENVLSSYASMRNSIDLNQVLLSNELSIRAAAVHDEQNYQQQPAFNNSTRYYGALRYEPKLFRDDAHTSLRAKYEHGSVRSNNPRTIPPVDMISPWFDRMNKLTLNQYVLGTDADPTQNGRDSGSNYAGANFNATSQTGGMAQGRSYWPDVLSYYNGANPDQTIPPTRSATATNVITPMINTGWALNSAGAVAPGGGIGGLPVFRPVAIPYYSLYATYNASLPGGSYYADRVITDTSIFDFYNNLLDGDNKRESQDWSALNVAFAQTFFGDRLGFEAVLDHQDYRNSAVNALQGVNHAISIDVNETFADGSHNPNVGRPYVASGTGGNRSNSLHVIRDSVRFTALAEFRSEDFLAKSRWTDALGRHVFTGLWSRDGRKSLGLNWADYATTPDWAVFGNVPINTQTTNRQFDWVYYLGPGLWDRTSPANAHLKRITNLIRPTGTSVVRAYNSRWNAPNVNPGDPFTYTSFQTGVVQNSTQSQNPANYVGWQNVPVTWMSATNPDQFGDLVTTSQKLRFRDTSKGIIWQGYMFGGDFVPTFGWRKDSVVNYATSGPIDPISGATAVSFDDDPTSRRDAVGESKSWGGVYHLPKALMAKVPGGTTLSVFYNRSSNFKADAPRTNLRGDTIGNPSGDTKEYGFTLTTLDDKITLKMDWYTTKVSNATFNVTNGNSIAGLGGNGYWMWAAPTWGLMYASAVEATLDNLPGANSGNYAQNDGVPGAADPSSDAFLNAPQTALSRQIVDAWLHLPVPDSFFQYYGIHPLTYNLGAANGKIRNAISGWSVNSVAATGSQQPGAITAVSTVDTLSKGTELELSAQPTKNWNISINYSRTFATKQNIDAATVQFMSDLNTFFTGPGGQLRLWGQAGSPIGPQWVTNVYNPYLVSVLSAGQSTPEVAPWRVNVVTTYNFDHGPAKGFFVGGGMRMEAGKILGYTYNAQTGTLDVSHPLNGPNDTHFDAWFGYTRKLRHDVGWRIQLNLRDVAEHNRLVAARYQPDGTLALARIQSGMSWQLTNTFDF